MSRLGRSIALGCLVLLVTAGGAGAQAGPTLKSASTTPLILKGSGFHSGEHVSLLLLRSGRGRVSRSVEAGAGGTFVVRFPLFVATQPCRSLEVRAVGSRGSRALYTHRCQPPDPALP